MAIPLQYFMVLSSSGRAQGRPAWRSSLFCYGIQPLSEFRSGRAPGPPCTGSPLSNVTSSCVPFPFAYASLSASSVFTSYLTVCSTNFSCGERIRRHMEGPSARHRHKTPPLCVEISSGPIVPGPVLESVGRSALGDLAGGHEPALHAQHCHGRRLEDAAAALLQLQPRAHRRARVRRASLRALRQRSASCPLSGAGRGPGRVHWRVVCSSWCAQCDEACMYGQRPACMQWKALGTSLLAQGGPCMPAGAWNKLRPRGGTKQGGSQTCVLQLQKLLRAHVKAPLAGLPHCTGCFAVGGLVPCGRARQVCFMRPDSAALKAA